MPSHAAALAALELWGGIECTVNRVRNRWTDQTARTGHDTRLDDLDRFAGLGLRALRYPVLWERVAPSSLDAPEWAWSDERLDRLRALGIRPIAGLLHHGSGPAYTSLLDDEFPLKLARYAGMVAARYPWLTDYTPINEPLTTARFSALYGFWYPHRRNARLFVRALFNQMRGIALAMKAIRAVNPAARLIQTEDCGLTLGTAATRVQVTHEAHRRWLTWDLLTGRVTTEHPVYDYLRHHGATDEDFAFFAEHACPPDVLGLNYYLTSDRYLDERLDRYPMATHGGNGRLRYADVEAVRVRRAGIVGHEQHLMFAWERYGLPVAITEVHLGCTRDEQARWLVEAWRGAEAARARGADVRAVTPWALLGAYDWDSLVTKLRGHYEPGAFDVRGGTPRPTLVSDVIQTLAAGKVPDHPVLQTPGWWHRPERLLYERPEGAPAIAPARRPLLVFGRTGTLGRAFERLCAARGLAVRSVGRNEADITNASQVDAVIRAAQPWAVINAAGYVRVDDAERDPEGCRLANVTGAVNLAAACRRRGVPFVTFSTDLVFDGTAGRAYTEHDAPRPLNVYGCSKAEAEQRVLAVLPGALVVRTSAFFGPWDQANFLSRMLQALSRGERFHAPDDTIVSPTYVPDLVNATLDLLIDGADGIWHLANDGAMTWFEFATAAATLAAAPVDLIVPAPTADIWGPAARPRNSALTSVRGATLRPVADALAAFLDESTPTTLGEGARQCASS